LTTLKEPIKKTGYGDIDDLLINTHNLLQEVDEVQRDIAEALEFKPVNPFKTPRPKWKFRKTVKI
jgi:hypothetical protein